MNEQIRSKLNSAIASNVPDSNKKVAVQFTDTDNLSDLGLDSLGFALTIAKMEEEFGIDPFSDAEEILYPETFGEMLMLYDRALTKHQDSRKI